MNNMTKEQQQFGTRDTCTPTDASQVCSYVVLSLTREETLSEQDLKTVPNNLDVNLPSHTGGLDLRVSDIMYAFSPQFLHPLKRVVSLRVGEVGEV